MAELSFNDRVSKIMGEKLLMSHTMLATNCSKCGTILMRHPKTGDYCVGCNLVAEAVAEVKGESKVVKVNEDKPELKISIGDQVSKVMGEKLLQGHIMLCTYCDRCRSIMMRHPRTGDYCIKCDLSAQNAQFADSEQSNQQQQRQQQQQQVEEVEEEDDREPTGGSAQQRHRNKNPKSEVGKRNKNRKKAQEQARRSKATALAKDNILSNNIYLIDPDNFEAKSCVQVLQHKITWAASEMMDSDDISRVTSLAALVEQCAKSVCVLQSMPDSTQ